MKRDRNDIEQREAYLCECLNNAYSYLFNKQD